MRERSLHRVGSPIGDTQSQEAILLINNDGGIMKRTEVIFVTELAKELATSNEEKSCREGLWLHTDLREIKELYVRSRSTTPKYGIGVTACLDDG